MAKRTEKVFGGKVYRYWSMSSNKKTSEASAEKMREKGMLARITEISWKSCPVCKPKKYYVVWLRGPRDSP